MRLFIDLFFTLCSPFAPGARTEWDALGIPEETWLTRVEEKSMCIRRELGLLYDTPVELMRDVLHRTGLATAERDVRALTNIRIERMRRAVTEIRPEILRTLDALHEAIYRIALERTGADPTRSVFIGDGGSDEHRGAKRVGLNTILVTHLRPRSEAELAPLLPHVDARTDDFTKLPKLMTQF